MLRFAEIRQQFKTAFRLEIWIDIVSRKIGKSLRFVTSKKSEDLIYSRWFIHLKSGLLNPMSGRRH